MKFLVYKDEQVDPFWVPSKIFLLNWFMFVSWIMGLLFFFLIYFFLPNYSFFDLWLITSLFTGYCTGYLSCFTDIADYPPAGIKWGFYTGVYLWIGIYTMLFTIFPLTYAKISRDVDIMFYFLVTIIITSFFGLLGRFHHEFNISLRLERYYQVKPLQKSSLLILIIEVTLILDFVLVSLLKPIEGEKPYLLQLPNNLWYFNIYSYLVAFFWFLLVFIYTAFKKMSQLIKARKEELDKFTYIIYFIYIGLPLIILLILLPIIQKGVLLGIIDQTSAITIGRTDWYTFSGTGLTVLIGVLAMFAKTLYDIELIDYKLYNRWH